MIVNENPAVRRCSMQSLCFALLLSCQAVAASSLEPSGQIAALPAALPSISCWLEYTGEESTLEVRVVPLLPLAPEGEEGGWQALGKFRLRSLLAVPDAAPPWLQLEVHALAADEDYRVIALQKVAAPFATGRMEVVEPRLGRSLRYECPAAKTPGLQETLAKPAEINSARQGVSALPPTGQATKKVTVAFVGDVMLAESEATGRLLAAGGDPFARVRNMLAAADLRVANFESSAGSQGQADPGKPYSFRTAPLALSAFSRVFEAASLANNHAGDFGRADFVETLAGLAKTGVKTFGGGRSSTEAHQPLIIERHGIKIGLIGYLDFFPRWFTAGPGLAGVAWLDADLARRDIAQARAAGAEVVIVMPHWGMEDEPQANDRQPRLARALIDAGADAVIGGHPHVVQDHEIYQGKPIIYSLGNFVFDGFEDAANLTGWAAFVDMDRNGIAAITTRVVHIDANGSPAPAPDQTGPCWTRGAASMTSCPPGVPTNISPSQASD